MAEYKSRTGEDRSIGELFGELSQDMALLVRQETQLAKTEMQQKLSKVTTDLVALATGGIVAYLGGLALTAFVILLLIDPIGLKPWLAALIVGVVLGVVGWMMLQRGLKEL
jgi:drug/metabolite transporter (DMT)-like permease